MSVSVKPWNRITLTLQENIAKKIMELCFGFSR